MHKVILGVVLFLLVFLNSGCYGKDIEGDFYECDSEKAARELRELREEREAEEQDE